MKRRINYLFFMNNKGFAGESEEDDKETVSKEEYDKAIARTEELEKEYENVRMEVLTPQYMKWLDEQGEDKDKPKPQSTTPDDPDLEKMSKKEIFEAAKQAALDAVDGRLKKEKEESAREQEDKTKKQIAAFAKTHDDYETFRPIMYGLSLDPKNESMSLQELYDAAKAHVKRISGDASEDDKRRSRKSSNERPGGDNDSFEKYQKMSSDQIAQEAAEEVSQSLGPLPSA